MANPASLTAQYLTGFKQIPIPERRRRGHAKQKLRIVGARENNLQDLTIALPLAHLHVSPGCPAAANRP